MSGGQETDPANIVRDFPRESVGQLPTKVMLLILKNDIVLGNSMI